ncbi:MAG: stalk domain-containing protein [Bacillota bacterium]
MKKLFFILMATVVLCVFPAAGVQGAEAVRSGTLDVDGAAAEEQFLLSGGKVFVPLKGVTDRLNITMKWEAGTGDLILTYRDQTSIRVSTKGGRIYAQDTSYPAEFLVSQGRTYICIEDLPEIARRQVYWDSVNSALYVYMYANPVQGSSILDSLPYEGLSVNENTVCFSVYGLPEASWQMQGELMDLRLLDRTVQGNMEEIQTAAFYVQPGGVVSQLILTQRKLPNGDRMFFTRGYTPGSQQVVTVNTQPPGQVFGGKGYHFIDKGILKEYQFEEPFRAEQRLTINAGTSVDQWHIFSQQDLTLDSYLLKKAWNASFDYHKSNAWVTPEGTYRSTPPEYFNNRQLRNQNVNLQACVPMLLLDALNVQDCRLFEDFVHSAKFTLVKLQGRDGFWRSGINVAYLNRAYSLGPNFIDTRMSVDASLFLLRYGLMFGDQDAVNRGAHFKKFFTMMKGKQATYNLGGGVLYPDYYSESQKGKTLVSLNHALYEMNYLYTLYNDLGDNEARALADEMRLFINNSADRWVKPNGDLYYALSPQGQYYAEDYVNITYVDLFVANSILDYMEVRDAAVESLLKKKGDYLDAVADPQFESHLHVDTVLENFDTQSSRKGDFFFVYPLEVKMSDWGNPAYFACGTYHWIKGADSITYLGKTYDLDPMEKYVVVLNKWGLTLRSNGEIIPE